MALLKIAAERGMGLVVRSLVGLIGQHTPGQGSMDHLECAQTGLVSTAYLVATPCNMPRGLISFPPGQQSAESVVWEGKPWPCVLEFPLVEAMEVAYGTLMGPVATALNVVALPEDKEVEACKV